jgi:DNA-binding transcriptional regulator LsrR (DeoR family)
VDLDEMNTARRKNSPLEILTETEEQAARLREKLGLDSVTVLLERRQAEQEAALERMAAMGAEIAARRFGSGGPPG